MKEIKSGNLKLRADLYARGEIGMLGDGFNSLMDKINSLLEQIYTDFAFPTLIIFTAFVVYPIIPAIIISIQKHDGFKSSGYIGLLNYIDVLKSSTFWLSNYNTFLIVVISLFIALPTSLILALVIDKQSQGTTRFFKSTSVFPAVLSVTVIA